ncbi:hypothetical protein [Burkholderia vietnamiensis]|uniref:hypothetical protein n=1 Tax=Burkholderia vietnamiensis TaxID=60552 RepID=UPI0012D98A39|nr:hypothetical protein [Burkholderia vietnamiensis]MBH9645401.1 hypothetical protein [Burkholderia vietnamiensis]MBR7908446.1 hypothetical protein [Burkholderia vietnamiensis]MBR8004165.1 hypothetical protein [Burkholderia vietnamiensis]MBR8161263.1 hypothetical protein [Burkholderia vietnamiensis]MDN8043353.1 hypothetical protein [Burkholderia vietnamiensis]
MRIKAGNMRLHSMHSHIATSAVATRGGAAHPSKVRIYRSHGEQIREPYRTAAQCASGDACALHISTAKIANGSAPCDANYALVYRNSPPNPRQSRRMCETRSFNRGELPFDTRCRIARRRPKNKTVRGPWGRSHRQ